MIKTLLNKLANPLLFYVDKSGMSVFRNYCLIKNDGYKYDETFSIQTAGKALEYRLNMDKKLKNIIILITILTYFLFINLHPSIINFMLCELLWILLVFSSRLVCSELYRKFIINNFGKYNITNFNPTVSQNKIKRYKQNFHANIIITTILIALFFAPSFFIMNIIKFDIKSKKPHYKADIVLSNIYNTIYPKNAKIYDMTAYARYNTEDYEGSIKDYKRIFILKGKNFSKKDFTRFANLLYLEKKIYGSQTALDIFNDYITRKNLSIFDETKMLWIKSIFSIKNNISEFVIQDYDDLLQSLKETDYKNRFYILSDKAYMLYIMKEYKTAIEIYDSLIDFAQNNQGIYKKEIPRLLAERGFAKRRLGYNLDADDDFIQSNIDMYEIEKYEPKLNEQGFIGDKF